MAMINQAKTVQAQQKTTVVEQSKSQTAGAAKKSTVRDIKENMTDMQNSSGGQTAMEGIQYDVTERTSQIAAWWKDMEQQEEEIAAEEEALAEEEKALPWEKGNSGYDEAEEGIRSLERMLERLREKQKNANSNKNNIKRKLTYNHKKISTAIGGAKTLMQASNALASANTNLNAIRRKAASGKYDEDEIAIAKNHAMKMVRAARRKVRHIKLEVNQDKQNTVVETKKRQDTNDVISRPKHQKMEEELLRLKKELEREEKQYKNMHRRKEGWDLMQADMEYLRRKIDLMRREEDRVVVENVSSQEIAPAVSEMTTSTLSSGNEQTIEAQQEAAMAVAEASVASAAVSIDVTV